MPSCSFFNAWFFGGADFNRHAKLLFAELGDFGWFDGLVARAALRVEESEQLLQNGGIGSVPKKSAFTTNSDQILVSEFFQVVRERRGRDAQLALNLANDHSLGMCGEQRPQNAQTRLRT